MSEMLSWFKTKDGFLFLTDDDVISYHENKGNNTEYIKWDDYVGHSGLMKVYNLPNIHAHQEGFVGMPLVGRKAILDGKMNKLFAHAGNLREATPEFIPLMRRLAVRSRNVAEQLENNPYRHCDGIVVSNAKQMEIGVKNNFKGSTVGNLLRDSNCDEKSMLIALEGARELMDEHTDHHHYHHIVYHENVTKHVLKYILDHVNHQDVREWVMDRLPTLRSRRKRIIKTAANYKDLKVRTIRKGRAKIRAIV